MDADTLRRANAVHPISLIEAEYSLFNRRIENDILPITRELGIGVVAFGALAHGLLSGTFSKESVNSHNFWIPLFSKDNIDKNLELVEALRVIADEKKITIPQIALGWLLSKGDDIMTLVGASRRSTLRDSLKSIDVNLSSDDIKRIEKVIPANEISGGSFPMMQFRNGEVVRK